MAELDRAVTVATAHNLQLSAIAAALNRSWFGPEQIRFALFKGVALAQRYYGNRSRWRDIYAANRNVLPSESALRIGMELKIHQ